MRFIAVVTLKATIAAAVFSAPTNLHAATPEQNRSTAAMVEWAIANCDTGEISAIVLSMATLTINGSSMEDIEAARGKVRKGVAEYYPSTQEACDDIVPRLKATSDQ